MNILLCDDNEQMLNNIEAIIENWKQNKGENVTVHKAVSAEQAVSLSRFNVYHAAFLDIKMPKISGLELAEKLKEKLPDIYIIFITHYSEYISDACYLNIFTYIQKGLLDEKLPGALDRLAKKLGTKEEVFFYKIQRTEYFVKVNRINYFQMQSHNVSMHLKDGVVEFREPMSKLMERLPKDIFIKINKSIILNVLQIDEIRKLSVIMSNGKEISGTAKSMRELRELRLDSYLRSKM